MRFKAERVKSWADGKPLGPVRVELHPTNICNLKCRFCWQTNSKPQDFSESIPDKKLFQIVDDAAEMGAKEWIVSGGGEPLVKGQVTIDLMRKIKEHGMWGQLTTNGVLFTKKWVEDVVKMGWDQVQISLDAPDAKTHDFLRRGKGSFDKAVQTAKWFSEARKKYKTNKPYLGFNTCITQRVYNKLCDMIKLGKKVGFDLVYFEPVYAGYVSKHRFTLNEKEKKLLSKEAKKAKELANKIGIATNADRFINADLVNKESFRDVVIRETEDDENKYISAPCYQPWYLMGIKGSGLVGCCSTFEIGEKIQDKSLKEIWFGDLFNKMRKEMLSKQLPKYCEKCSVVVVMDNKDIRNELKKCFELDKLSKFHPKKVFEKAKRKVTEKKKSKK